MQKIKILTVEDELIIAQDLEEILEELGYEVIDNAPTADKAIKAIRKHLPDLVILDFRLADGSTGAEVAEFIRNEKLPIPFIFLTSHADPKTVSTASQTMPYGYVVKPFESHSLYAAIEIALRNCAKLNANNRHEDEINGDEGLLFNDCLFVKYRTTFIKIPISEIDYLEADSNYTILHTCDQKYIIRNTLGSVLDSIDSEFFLRIHRSYAVNIHKIKAIERSKVIIEKTEVPLGRTHYDKLTNIIKTLTSIQ